MPHGLDNSPKIVEHGVYWGRGMNVKNNDSGWSITDWIYVKQQITGGILTGYVGANDVNNHTFQYYNENETKSDWYYFNNGDQEGNRQLSRNFAIAKISFSIYTPNIENTYAYIQNTGEILFAGKNSIYYGHSNISELN